MGFEILYCDLCGIASVASWRYKLQCHVVVIADHVLHRVGNFVVEDMLFGLHAGAFEAEEQVLVCAFHFAVLPAFHRLN